MDLIKRVWMLTKKHPHGFTFDLRSEKLILKGIIVAHEATQHSFGNAGLKTCIEHAQENDRIIGCWLNEDNHYQFDSVKVFTDLEKAMNFAIENKQRFIYDLTNLREIKVRD